MDLSVMKSLDSNEIPEILRKAAPFGGTITLPTLTSCLTLTIRKLEIQKNGGLSIELFEEVPLETSWHITLKLNYRNITFHLDPKQYVYQDKSFLTEFPKKANALTLRETDRYILPMSSNVKSSIHRVERRGICSDIDALVVDISNNGIGMVVRNADEETLLKNDHIWIRSINNITLPKPIFGKIVYVNNSKIQDDKLDSRIGIQLTELIPDKLLLDIQEMCEMVMSA